MSVGKQLVATWDGWQFDSSPSQMEIIATDIDAAIATERDKLAGFKDEVERLRVENIQLKFACGYPMPAGLERHIIPHNPFRCGVCDAREQKARPFGLQAAVIEPIEYRYVVVASGELDPRPHDLMWVDDCGYARHISDVVLRTVSLEGRECLLFVGWADIEAMLGRFLAAPDVRAQ